MKKEINLKYIYIFKALAILTVITLISNIFREHLQLINIALIHILPVIFVAIHGNLKATFFITFISVILLNFGNLSLFTFFASSTDIHPIY